MFKGNTKDFWTPSFLLWSKSSLLILETLVVKQETSACKRIFNVKKKSSTSCWCLYVYVSYASRLPRINTNFFFMILWKNSAIFFFFVPVLYHLVMSGKPKPNIFLLSLKVLSSVSHFSHYPISLFNQCK